MLINYPGLDNGWTCIDLVQRDASISGEMATPLLCMVLRRSPFYYPPCGTLVV